MFQGQGLQLYAMGNQHVESTLKSPLSCFIYHRGIEEETFAVFFFPMQGCHMFSYAPQHKKKNTSMDFFFKAMLSVLGIG